MKEDSRANYADIIQVEHDAQVLVVGEVVKYFDRVRRNVNKAFMRQILRTALEKYQAEKAAGIHRPPSIMESVDGDQGGAECRHIVMETDRADTYTLNEVPTDDERDDQVGQVGQVVPQVAVVKPTPPAVPEKPQQHRRSSTGKTPSVPSDVSNVPEDQQPKGQGLQPPQDHDYDLRSMHKVAMAGMKQ